jgi:hypothetical protein
VPIAVLNATALDTVLARLVLAAYPLLQQHPNQAGLLEAPGALDQALADPLETTITAFVP